MIAFSACAGNVELQVDCAQSMGELRPLHGGNSGPLNYGGLVDLSAFHRELAIPYTRLHDCHWPNTDVVDIHCVFPDFKADPEKPESYDFERTDEYIKAIVNTGSKIVYRLGESIEHTAKKYHAHPPADYDKWAAVCVGIVRHYNDGWANGFRYNIRHWEIWNEPENRPAMWDGSDDDYYRLYGKASKAIKSRFPDVLVGGPAVGNSGETKNGAFHPTPFVTGFLDYCRRESAPLDFFSWHGYSDDPDTFAARARDVRWLLDNYGFKKTASHLNEWNYLPRNDWGPMLLPGQGAARERIFAEIGGPQGAAFSAYVLMSIQDSPVDVANYFTAEIQGFGLFTFHAAPKKTFYAFKAFKILLDTPLRVEAKGAIAGSLAICAGVNPEKTEVHVLVSQFKQVDGPLKLAVRNLPWDGTIEYETSIVDADRDLKVTGSGKSTSKELTLSEESKAPFVWLIKVRKSK